MKLTQCYLCGAQEAHKIHHGVRGGELIDVLKCVQCGLVRLSETVDDVDGFYSSSGMRTDETNDLEQIRLVSRVDDERRFRYTERMIEGKNIIDFGCGAGGYLIRASRVAASVVGIELEVAMRHALTEEGIQCLSSIQSAGQADVITLFHVLEHLEDPLSYLEEFHRHLTPGGMIIIEIPNADDALLSLYKCRAFADFTYWICHIYLYTLSTLRMLVEKANYDVVFMRQVQRYSLANHMYWLSKGEPGGHYKWAFLEDIEMDQTYGNMLAQLGIADTIIAGVRPR